MKLETHPHSKPGWWSGDMTDTRDRILLAAFNEIHLYGYQSASIQNIIDQAGVTKGALYHHFRSKHEMAVALLDEVHAEYIENTFIRPMVLTDDPVTSLIEILYRLKDQMSDEDIALGCPLDNLAQEMAPIDDEIQGLVDQLYRRKQKKLSAAFKRGQVTGKVKTALSADTVALFIIAALQGCMGIAKSARSIEVLFQCGTGLIEYLEQLRPEPKI